MKNFNFEKYQFYIRHENEGMKTHLSARSTGDILTLNVRFVFEQPISPTKTEIGFSALLRDVYGVWSQQTGLTRNLPPDWAPVYYGARSAASIPLLTLFGAGDTNLLTVCVRDCQTPCALTAGYCEETSETEVKVVFFVSPIEPLTEYETQVVFDFSRRHFAECVKERIRAYEKDLKPAFVPDSAKNTVFSTWYCYHQMLEEKRLLDDCKAAKALGIDTVIIDDGWQTSDVSRGYGYCGDYRVAKEKISDMRRLVDNLHGLGIRAMLWYSVSFLGDFAQKTQKLKDKTLYHNDGSSCYVLDPRFAEVRRHIVESCIQAIKEWDFDGLKLDFIDAFVLKNTNVPIGADCVSLEEGIRKLLRELSTALGAIKPNVLIEFRQGYVGPAMRTLCNMIRVGDCPGSMLINRTGIVDLRLTSGNTAVHSDPLVWEKDATVEEVGRYFANVLFSVVQVSAAPSDLTEEQQKVVAQYVAFMKRHRKVLLESEFTFDGALENYPVIAGFDDHTKITGVYANALVGLEKDKEIVVNGGVKSVVTVKTDETYSYVAVDACGNKVGEGQISGLAEIGVPLGGMVELSVV